MGGEQRFKYKGFKRFKNHDLYEYKTNSRDNDQHHENNNSYATFGAKDIVLKRRDTECEGVKKSLPVHDGFGNKRFLGQL